MACVARAYPACLSHQLRPACQTVARLYVKTLEHHLTELTHTQLMLVSVNFEFRQSWAFLLNLERTRGFFFLLFVQTSSVSTKHY